MAGLSKDFLWGGATAANQYEGGFAEGGKGPGTVDVIPAGEYRRTVCAGEMDYHLLPLLPLLVENFPYRRGGQPQRGGPALLRADHRCHAGTGHPAGGDYLPL